MRSNEIQFMESKLDQCQQNKTDAIESCREKFSAVQKTVENLNQGLKKAQLNIDTLKNEKEKLQNQLHSVSEKEKSRMQQLVNLSDALTDWRTDLWHEIFTNGAYLIAYEFNPGLHPKLKSMLPKVRRMNHQCASGLLK